ncbi:hypothetical protein ES703_10075 [subsurface metagenome]
MKKHLEDNGRNYKMSKDKRIDALIQTIRADPHWEIIIRPFDFKKERITKLSECWNLMENCRVTLRGWDYPHVDRRQENSTLGEDWIASWCELFMGHQEFWKFFQSGQFIHYLSFWENSKREEAAKRAISNVLFAPKDFKPSGYISVLSTLDTLTEIFKFTSCLANKGVFGGYVIMTLKMLGIKDHLLFMWDPGRILHGCYSATQSLLEKQLTIDTPELISNSAEISLNTTLWFFERFKWFDP